MNIKKLSVILGLLLILIAVCCSQCPKKKNSSLNKYNKNYLNKKGIVLVAHRGGVVNDTVSQHSIPALEEAINRGYSHVEVDLRCTKDGRVVCFHDNNLWRTWWIYKKISDLTLAELTALANTKHKAPIITFEKFCANCEGRISLMLDIKGCDENNIRNYTKEIDAALTKYNLTQALLFIGNRSLAKKYFFGKGKIAKSVKSSVRELAKQNGANIGQHYFVFGHAKDFNQENVDYFHNAGLQVIVSINVFHYWKKAFMLKPGFNDIQKMLNFSVDGLQIDSCYDSFFLQRFSEAMH